MRFGFFLGLAALLATLAACATAPSSPPLATEAEAEGRSVAIVGVTVIPMTDDTTVLREQTVLIQDEMIVAVGPTAAMTFPASTTQIDGRGRYLIPGLTDMHVHLEHIEDPDILKLFVGHGVTTVRSMDGRPYMLDWRRRVAAGELIGPRIVTAGPIIDGAPPARDDNLAVADAEGARAAVRQQADAGYDFIKTYVNLSPEAYRAALAEAKARGLPLAGHTPRGVDLMEAAANQWSLEHLGDFAGAIQATPNTAPGWSRRFLAGPIDEARLSALAKRLSETGVWVVPTAVEKDRSAARPEVVQAWSREPAVQEVGAEAVEIWQGVVGRATGRMDEEDWPLLEQGRRNRLALIGAFHKAGVKLVTGSDTPNPFVAPGASLHLELANFVEAGLTPHQALRAATALPHQMLGALGGAGTIEPEKRADLVLLSADPLLDIAAAQSRVGVMLAGRWFEESQLRQMRQDLAAR